MKVLFPSKTKKKQKYFKKKKTPSPDGPRHPEEMPSSRRKLIYEDVLEVMQLSSSVGLGSGEKHLDVLLPPISGGLGWLFNVIDGGKKTSESFGKNNRIS